MTPSQPFVEGVFYHIYNRGNNKENIFEDEGNYNHFLKLWTKYIEPIAETYCYVLLKNHFHALIRIREDLGLSQKPSDISIMPKAEQAFANFFNAYAKSYNNSKNRTGKLFALPFKRKLVLSLGYIAELVFYIHANPQKHGFTNDFRRYPHSSYHSFLSEKPTKLMRTEIIKLFGGLDNFIQYHEEKANVLKPLEHDLEGDD